jgi:hypothetical protein
MRRPSPSPTPESSSASRRNEDIEPWRLANRRRTLHAALPKSPFDREAIPYVAAFLGGKAFLAYRRRGGTKGAPLPYFFIGAHAAVAGYLLMTRDAARYQSYFPKLSLIAPR